MLSLTLALALLPQQGPSEKELFDEMLGQVRSLQAADGHYGGGLTDTANALIALALSPRAYRVDDGPFFRDAAQWLVQHRGEAAGDERLEARVALALAHAHLSLYQPAADEILARRGWTRVELPRRALGAADGRTALEILLAIQPDAGPSALLAETARAAIQRALAPKPRADEPDVRKSYERGVDFLLAERGPDGLWHMFGAPEAGISAMAARALLGSERAEARTAALPTLEWLRSLQREDGSIHAGRVAVYTTAVAIGALKAGGRAEDGEAIASAVAYLKAVQCDESEGYSEADKFYGGIGYGNDLRPDLSNLQYALEALHEAGVGTDDPAFQRAVHFLQRSQNRSETNRDVYLDGESATPVRSGDDGGAVYYPGNSFAGTERHKDGSLVARSYGSMTYALLKCYAFAGLDAADPRVAAAVAWISEHWTLEVNPGFDVARDLRAGHQGLYYYYETLAEALQALGLSAIEGPGGVVHDWRAELAAKLVAVQREDGSWQNPLSDRWLEGNPVLCTAYALNALRATRR